MDFFILIKIKRHHHITLLKSGIMAPPHQLVSKNLEVSTRI